MIGVCKYCGQTVTVEAENKIEADKFAAENCDCTRARQERELTRIIESAKERLIDLVGDDCEKYGFEPIEIWAVLQPKMHIKHSRPKFPCRAVLALLAHV